MAVDETWPECLRRFTSQRKHKPGGKDHDQSSHGKRGGGSGKQTDTPEFKSWFGDSKVVENDGTPKKEMEFSGIGSGLIGPDGEPRVMYHGTSFGGFTEFSDEFSGAATTASSTKYGRDNDLLYGPGHYFTSDKEVAKGYSKIRETQTIYPTGSVDQIDSALKRTEDAMRKEFKLWVDADMEHDGIHIKSLADSAGELRESMELSDSKWVRSAYHTINAGASTVDLHNERGEGAKQEPIPNNLFETKLSSEVKEVYLSIKSPFRAEEQIDDESVKRIASVIDSDRVPGTPKDDLAFELSRPHMIEDNRGSVLYHRLAGVGGKRWTNETLQKAGFDGITHHGGVVTGGEHKHDVWIAFTPTQIKSATDNDGTFDPSNPDITKSLPAAKAELASLSGWLAGSLTTQKSVRVRSVFERVLDRLDAIEDSVENMGQRKSGCGANAIGGGGFQKGNTCGGNGGGSANPRQEAVREWASKEFGSDDVADEFTEWFGSSKISNSKGIPTEVFHGNRGVDDLGSGWVSFTDDEDHAGFFGDVSSGHIRIENPIDISDIGSGGDPESPDAVSGEDLTDAFSEFGINIDFGGKKRRGFTTELMHSKKTEIIEQAKASGYDGLIVTDYFEYDVKEYVIFERDQARVSSTDDDDD